MKNLFTLFISIIMVVSSVAQITFCDDFEGYQNGDPIAQTSVAWNSWGELMSGTTAPFIDDANVTNVLSYSVANSLYLFSGTTQGLQDVVLPFGTGAPYEFGMFEFSSMFYVNLGTGAYFNFQAENIPGTTWSLDVKMDLGTIIAENTGSGINYLTSTYPENQWFELKVVSDLTNNNWEIFIDGVSIGSFMNTVNKIASLDLYPIIGHEFYVDDVCYAYTPPDSTWDCDGQGNCSDPGTGLGVYSSLSSCQANCIIPTWGCDNWNCHLWQGPGQGSYTSLAACQASCIMPTWDCINGVCIDPGTTLGSFIDSLQCVMNCTQTNLTDFESFNGVKLIKIVDVLGQESPYKKRGPLFYIYDDGTVEKRIVIE